MNNNVLEIVLRLKDELSAQLKSSAGSIKNVGKSFEDVGASMVKIGAAPTAALVLAAKSAMDYESAFAGVRKTVAASESEFAQLSQNLRDIAKRAPVSANELAGIAEMAGQLGISGVDNLTRFTETVTKFTTATGIAGEEAATEFARIANVMQEPIKNIDRMGSVVAQLGDSSAATERDILNFASRIAGAGQIAGLATRDVFAIGAAMASVGVEAEAGGTAVQKVLLDINTTVVTGGENLAIYARLAGQTADEFAKSWESNPSKAFASFVEGLGKEGDKAITTLSELGLEDQRLIRAFLSLANAGSLLTDQIGIANNEWTTNSRLTVEAQKRYATTASQLQIFKNNMVDIGITIGSVVLPAINNMLNAIRPTIELFARFAQEHPNLIAGFLAIGAAIGVLGALLIPIGMLISSIGTIVGVVAPLFVALGAAIAGISAPVLIVIGVITALIAIGYLLYHNWDLIRVKAFEIWNNLIMFFSTLPDTIGNFFRDLFLNRIPYAVGYAVGWLSVVIPQLVSDVITWFSELPPRILDLMIQVKDWIVTKFTETWSWISATVPTWPGKIESFIKSIPQRVRDIFEQAKQWALNKMNEMWEGITNIWNKIKAIFENIINTANKAWEAATKGFNAGKQAGMSGYATGGWVGNTGPAIVHEGEYVLSRDMLAGRAPVDSRVMNSNNRNIEINAVINNPLDFDAVLDQLNWRLDYAY